MKIAIVHDWIVTLGGAERVLKELCEIFPNADVYTLLFNHESIKDLGIPSYKVKSSFINKIPLSKKYYRYLLPLMPNAIESFDLSQYELIISSSHCVAKGVLTNSKQIHVSYVHTPMRYAWDMYHSYLKDAGLNRGIKNLLAGQVFKKIRLWDLATANRPDYYIANSKCVSNRIKKVYGKDSKVIYPPINIANFPISNYRENFYITAGRLVSYKRVDIIVEAFSKLRDKKLLIIGDGPELKRLKNKANRNVEFLGNVDQKTLSQYLGKARAFIFAAEEDFGILPVEAQACGTPVIAYRGGGATETVIEGLTGVFFDEQTPDSLIDAIKRFEKAEDSFSAAEIRKNAERFSRERFRTEFLEFIKSVLENPNRLHHLLKQP